MIFDTYTYFSVMFRTCTEPRRNSETLEVLNEQQQDEYDNVERPQTPTSLS